QCGPSGRICSGLSLTTPSEYRLPPEYSIRSRAGCCRRFWHRPPWPYPAYRSSPTACVCVALRLREIQSNGTLKIVLRHSDVTLFIAPDGLQNIDHIERITGPQLGPPVGLTQFPQVLAAIGLERDVASGSYAAENLVKCVLVHRLDINLIVNAAEKRLIGQIVRVEVGGENYHYFKRNLELHAVLQ